MEKSDKNLSCCDYFVSSRGLGSYLKSDSFRSSLNLKNGEFNKLLNISQIMAKKNYFLKYLENFKEFYKGKEINFIDKAEIAFIELPLVQINKLNKISRDFLYKLDSSSLENSFQMKFMFELYSLLYQKKILFNDYPYKLIMQSLSRGDAFIMKYLFNSIFNKEKQLRIKNLS